MTYRFPDPNKLIQVVIPRWLGGQIGSIGYLAPKLGPLGIVRKIDGQTAITNEIVLEIVLEIDPDEITTDRLNLQYNLDHFDRSTDIHNLPDCTGDFNRSPSPRHAAEMMQTATKEYTDVLVWCTLYIQNRKIIKIEVHPRASMLLIRLLKEPKRRRGSGLLHVGDLTLQDIYEVAKAKRSDSFANTFAGTVLEVLGTCVSLVGVTVEGKTPKEMQQMIKEGTITVPEDEE